MTIINPNSIAGITSVTAQADVINFFKSNGALAGLQLNGVNFNTTNGISTFNNLTVGGTLTYEDVKNVDSVGIISARTAIHVGAGISAVGIITATAFKLSDGTAVGGVTSDAQENTIGGTDAGSVLDSDTYRNTLFGYQAGEQINSGDDNTCIGWKAADKLTSGSKNCAVGSEALENISSGSDNVAMGWEAGRSLTSGSGNVMLGNMAGRTMSGNDNIAIGDHAYSNGGGTRSIGMGGQAVFLGGTDVIGLGYYASARSCTGSIGIGYQASRNTVGNYNTYIGHYAARGKTSSPYHDGTFNVGIGYRTLYVIESGSYNIAQGYDSGRAITTGSNNLLLGREAGYSGSNNLTTGSNNILLGYGAAATSATVSNEVTIGNSSIDKFRIPGLDYTIDDGRVLIGHSSARVISTTVNAYLQLEGTNYNQSAISVTRNTNDAYGSYFILGKSRGTSVGSNSTLQDGDTIGEIRFAGSDGSDMASVAALIRSTVDGTPGTDDMPGALTFNTTADGAATTTERLRITSAGSIGIGENSPSEKLDVNGTIQCLNELRSRTGNDLLLNAGSANRDVKIQVNDVNMLYVKGDTGKVGIGVDNPDSLLHIHDGSAGSIAASSAAKLTIESSASDYNVLQFLSPSTAAQQIRFGDASDNGAGWIQYNHANNSLGFGANGPERLRIASDGKVHFGSHASVGANGYILKETSGDYKFNIFASSSTTTNRIITINSRSNVEAMRIDANGLVLIGKTSSAVNTTGVELSPNGNNMFTRNGNTVATFNRNTNNGVVVSLQRSGNEGGTINITPSSCTYNSASDYRLKENEVAISDGITRLKQLKPYRFNFKAEPFTDVDGFFAHEVQTVVPQAVTGTKDEVVTEEVDGKSIGDPIYQGMDHGKLVPLLTAALQEAIAKIEVLETKVAALESS